MTAHRDPRAAGTLVARTAAQATLLAATSGVPVEVLPDRTEFSQTFAEPGGGFEAQEYLEPQRVQAADGSWAAVDPTLSVGADGAVVPNAIATGLTLSDGGTGPLFTLSQGGRSLSVSWPFGPLPTPALSGSTATYSGVLPGVNLLVTATATGVGDTIEVTSAAGPPRSTSITPRPRPAVLTTPPVTPTTPTKAGRVPRPTSWLEWTGPAEPFGG